MKIAIIGSGFGGLGAAIQCQRAGFADFTVFEKENEVGGVWRDNTYPGSACDVPSFLYSYSFATKADWSRRFATQPEILEYLHEIKDRYDLSPRIRLGCEVLGAAFDENLSKWTLELADAESFEADILIVACGQLSQPAYPAIPGLDSFEGKAFHSARWQHDHDLAGQKVAVLGTGASAIQFIPEVAKTAAAVKVFQRSAPYVIAKQDDFYDQPLGPASIRLRRWGTYWLKELFSYRFNHLPDQFARTEAGFSRYLVDELPDPAVRAQVKPTDRMGCKRILVSNDYYRSLNAGNVSVVNQSVAEVRPGGVVTADGRYHEADTVIYGTGFRATEFLAPMQITGRAGAELSQTWRDGAEAYLGITVAGFPNMFLVYGPNTNLGHNSIVFMIECQVRYIVQAIKRLDRSGLDWLDVRPDIHSEFNTRIQRLSKRTVFAQGCDSWYKTAGGKFTANWPASTVSYWFRTRRLRAGDFEWGPAAKDDIANTAPAQVNARAGPL